MDDHDDVLMNYKLLSHNILHKTRHSPGNIIPCASAGHGLHRVNKQLYSKTATDMVVGMYIHFFAIFDPHFFHIGFEIVTVDYNTRKLNNIATTPECSRDDVGGGGGGGGV